MDHVCWWSLAAKGSADPPLSGFPSREPPSVEKVGRHGGAHHSRDGRRGGVEQPAGLERGASDPEEVVQSGADAVQTLTRSLVRDWKVLPGMTWMQFKYSSFNMWD